MKKEKENGNKNVKTKKKPHKAEKQKCCSPQQQQK